MTLAVQVCLTVPYLYQRILLRFVQPMIFSAISVVWFSIIHSPAAMAAVGAVIGICAVQVAWRMRAQMQSARQSAILPVVAEPGTKDVLPVDIFLHEDSEDNQDSSALSLSSEEESIDTGEESEIENVDGEEHDDGGSAEGSGEGLEDLGDGEGSELDESDDDASIPLDLSTPSEWSLYESEWHSEDRIEEGEESKESGDGSVEGSGDGAGSQRSPSNGQDHSEEGGDVGGSSGASSSDRSGASAGDDADLP
jgi:hypothetical protein